MKSGLNPDKRARFELQALLLRTNLKGLLRGHPL